jgi:hypothetical protein
VRATVRIMLKKLLRRPLRQSVFDVSNRQAVEVRSKFGLRDFFS